MGGPRSPPREEGQQTMVLQPEGMAGMKGTGANFRLLFCMMNGFRAESCQIMNQPVCLLAVDGIALILLPMEI